MAKRTKLTEDDIYAIDQALRHCYKQDAYIFTRNGEEKEEIVDYYNLRKKFDGKQILDDHDIVSNLGVNPRQLLQEWKEKVEKFDGLLAESQRMLDEIAKLRIIHNTWEQENKQLKDEIHQLNTALKQSMDQVSRVLPIAEKSQQKLEKLKSLEYNLRNENDADFRPVLSQIRKILEEK